MSLGYRWLQRHTANAWPRTPTPKETAPPTSHGDEEPRKKGGGREEGGGGEGREGEDVLVRDR